MRFALYRVRAVLSKELAELRRNRLALLPVVGLALFAVALPLFIAIVVPIIAGEPLSNDPEFAEALKGGGVPLDVRRLGTEGAVQAFLFQQFLFMQLLVPVTGAMAFAGYSLIGEKQNRTLEPLLATPVTTVELLVAKTLGALLPSLAIMYGSVVLYLVAIRLVALPFVFEAVLNERTALLVLAVGPVAALVALQIAVLVSSRVNDPRTAQQFGALLILPLTAIFIAQFNGAVTLTVPIILLLLAALALIWLVLLVVGVAVFEREAILTRWK